jgi:hypothetical protein
MRYTPALVFVLAYLAPPAAQAQSGGTPGWRLGIAIEAIHFAESLIDTLAADATAAGLRPDGRLGVRLALGRAFGPWRAELETGWAAGRIEVGTDVVSLKDKTSRVTRWRLGAALGRRVGHVGAGEIELAAEPTLDWWRVSGADRLRAGAAAWLALRVPVGRWELENRIGGGVSGSPLEPEDAGPEFRRRTQVSVSAGVGLRLPL